MVDDELQTLIEKVSLEVFKKPFLHRACHNGRLRTTGGRYMLRDHSIQINPLVFQTHGIEELIGVIKHELCHYHLHLEGKGYQHRDADFKKLLDETSSPRYCKQLAKRNEKTTSFYIYECKMCKMKYERRRRMNVSKYRCGKCASEIKQLVNESN